MDKNNSKLTLTPSKGFDVGVDAGTVVQRLDEPGLWDTFGKRIKSDKHLLAVHRRRYLLSNPYKRPIAGFKYPISCKIKSVFSEVY